VVMSFFTVVSFVVDGVRSTEWLWGSASSGERRLALLTSC
jgi:hypothetical protein